MELSFYMSSDHSPSDSYQCKVVSEQFDWEYRQGGYSSNPSRNLALVFPLSRAWGRKQAWFPASAAPPVCDPFSASPFLISRSLLFHRHRKYCCLPERLFYHPRSGEARLVFKRHCGSFFQKRKGCIDTNGFSKAGAVLPLCLAVQRREQIFSYMKTYELLTQEGKRHCQC